MPTQKLRQGWTQTCRQRWFKFAPSDPFYMLLLGVDKDERTRRELGAFRKLPRHLLSWLRVDPKNKKITLISIPETLWI